MWSFLQAYNFSCMTLTLTYGNQANNSFPNLATSFQAFFLSVEQNLTFCYSSSHITIQHNTLLTLPKGLFRTNLQYYSVAELKWSRLTRAVFVWSKSRFLLIEIAAVQNEFPCCAFVIILHFSEIVDCYTKWYFYSINNWPR